MVHLMWWQINQGWFCLMWHSLISFVDSHVQSFERLGAYYGSQGAMEQLEMHSLLGSSALTYKLRGNNFNCSLKRGLAVAAQHGRDRGATQWVRPQLLPVFKGSPIKWSETFGFWLTYRRSGHHQDPSLTIRWPFLDIQIFLLLLAFSHFSVAAHCSTLFRQHRLLPKCLCRFTFPSQTDTYIGR